MNSRHIDRNQQIIVVLLPALYLLTNLIHYVEVELNYKSVLFKQRYELSGRNDRSVLYPSYKSLRTGKIHLAVKRYLRLIEHTELMSIKRRLHFVFNALLLAHLFKHTLIIESISAVIAVLYRAFCNIRKVAHTSYRNVLVDYPVNAE